MMDFSDIDTVIKALYTAISGPPGGQDWELEKQLYHADARLVRTRVAEDGSPLLFSFDVDSFVEATAPMLADQHFYEIETRRKLYRFGNIAQAFSEYEARDAAEGGTLLFKGMNMIHLFWDGTRWWIMHIIWDNEREGVSLPDADWYAD
ncbi:hypothetical protein HFP51_01285 [Parasphingopyxis sp. CP4]|uniref:hypothetical protein n=1 Tax=Parasphingopyxis sp. CP4 TaxID=2724527 RepID=UPI0015A4D338|nr:hypothetical protein [Parasphingopyxis sp. CP4]QLC20937.1 hypothetical protein HFP51_01285 [Parasphingopyxis sp. CP4]